MMKKIVSFAAAVIFCLAAPVCARAAQGGVWEIEELGISLTMPDDAYVLTRGVEAEDPGLAFVGVTQQEMLDFFEEENDYLMAVASDWRYEIYVTVEQEKKSWVSLSACSQSELAEAVDLTRTNYIDEGVEVLSCAAYDSGSAAFIEILYNYTEDNYTKYMLEYYTIYQNTGISVMLFSNFGEVDEAQQNAMRALVDEIRFNAGDPRVVAKNASGGSVWPYATGTAITLGGAALSVGLKQFAQRRADKKKKNAAYAPVSAAFEPDAPPVAYDARMDERLSNVGANSGAAAGAVFCGVCGAPADGRK